MNRRVVGCVSVAVVVGAALLVPTASAAPRAKRCPAFKLHQAPEDSWDNSAAYEAPIVRVSDRATEKQPEVVEFEVEPSVWWWAFTERGPAIGEGPRFYNFQVNTRRSDRALHLKLEWPSPTPDDFDMYLYDAHGTMLAWSEAANTIDPFDEIVWGPQPGGNGLEYIPGYPTRHCDDFSLQILPMWTVGRTVKLSAWLGPPEWAE